MDPQMLALLLGQGGAADPTAMGGISPDAGNPWEPAAPTEPPADGAIGMSSIAQPQGGGQQAGGAGGVAGALNALKGVTAPAAPGVVKPTTPGLPNRATIQQNALFNMLNSLTNPKAAAPPHVTLGSAVGTGRY